MPYKAKWEKRLMNKNYINKTENNLKELYELK